MRVSLNYKSVFLKYLSSSVIGSLVGLFSGFFTYRYIEPAQLGIWALFTVIEVYGTFTRLGIINGLGRELPYLLGKGETNLAKQYASTALFYALMSNLLLFLIVPLLFFNDVITIKDEYYLFSFLVILFRLLFSSYSSYLSVTFRTSKNFSELSNIQFVLTGVKLFSLILVVLYGFWGLLIREFMLSLIEMSLFHIKRPINVVPKFNLDNFKELFKVGFPLFLISYASSFIDTIPRLYIISFGTIEQLGLFSPIIIMLGASLLLPNAISSYIYPKMSYEYGQSNNKLYLWKFVKLTALASFGSGVIIFLTVFFIADYIEIVFPKYAASVPYIKLSSFALLFIGYKAAGISFSVLKSWRIMFVNLILTLIITFLSIFIGNIYFDDSLMIAVITIILTYCLTFVISLFLSYKITH